MNAKDPNAGIKGKTVLPVGVHLMPSTPDASGSLDVPINRTVAQRNVDEGTRRSLHVGRMRSMPLRMSIDLKPGHEEETVTAMEEGRLTGRIVRRRRRLPIELVLAFGAVSVICMLTAIAALGIGAYNLTKLRAGRAAKSIAQLDNEITPILQSILEAVTRKLRR